VIDKLFNFNKNITNNKDRIQDVFGNLSPGRLFFQQISILVRKQKEKEYNK